MYSREYFVERFREAETDELLERMAGGELTDEAQQAIQLVLKERGVSQAQLAPMVREAKKARYRRTTPTNECDFCGKSPGFLASAVKDAGQKFCSRECLRAYLSGTNQSGIFAPRP